MTKLIIFEGADNTGKSTIGKELAISLGIDYFKMKRDTVYVHQQDPRMIEASNFFQIEWFYSFATQVNFQTVLDRFYHSELVYGELFRKINKDAILKYDELFSKLDTHLITCIKEPENLDDELWDQETLKRIQNKFIEVHNLSKCHKLLLDTTDEDLSRQINKIKTFLHEDRNI